MAIVFQDMTPTQEAEALLAEEEKARAGEPAAGDAVYVVSNKCAAAGEGSEGRVLLLLVIAWHSVTGCKAGGAPA